MTWHFHSARLLIFPCFLKEKCIPHYPTPTICIPQILKFYFWFPSVDHFVKQWLRVISIQMFVEYQFPYCVTPTTLKPCGLQQLVENGEQTQKCMNREDQTFSILSFHRLCSQKNKQCYLIMWLYIIID